MKILIYNFVQPGEPGKQGGGVAVYQRNLMDALLQNGHEVISMSAGDRYSVLRQSPMCRYGELRRASGTLKTLHLYNSPVLAPAHTSFYSLDRYMESAALNGVPQDIKGQFGTIDVFHFQNLEGLTVQFFEKLRTEFPYSRILFSAHNYNLVCPQVNLWFRESSACVDYREGHACVNCIGGHGPNPNERNIRRMESVIALLGAPRHGRVSKAIEFAARLPFRLRRLLKRYGSRFALQAPIGPTETAAPRVIVSDELARPYVSYRATNLKLAADVFDKVIAVSHRTKAVLAKHGLSRDLIAVSYIGTSHHSIFAKAPKKDDFKDGIHIAYLGYMRADKGFFFFVDCLHLIPAHLAKQMTVTIAASHSSDWIAEQLKSMAQKFRSLILYNGYTHQTIDPILQNVDVGILPVLWEDNLPQVAIEIVSRGIPILTSDRGGASEIAGNPDFIFKAGSKRSFLQKLEALAERRVSLASFWSKDIRIFSMDQHLEDLMQYYEESRPEAPVRPPEHSRAALALL